MCISVLILTLNEEKNLPACLKALAWCDDIVVLDSYSTDRTVEIAKAAGARVYQREHQSEASQRLHGLKEISYKHAWVYMPDADEITPDDLYQEMKVIATDPTRPESFFRIRFKNMFMGRWIKHSSLYPTWTARLFRPERVHATREVHLNWTGDGPVGRINAHYLHYSFNNGMNAWFDKHNRYSAAEARETIKSLKTSRVPWRTLLDKRPEMRRKGLKELSMHLPFRPHARFLYMYLLRGGFLDGRQGYQYCRLLAIYEYMITIKAEELRRRDQGLSV